MQAVQKLQETFLDCLQSAIQIYTMQEQLPRQVSTEREIAELN